LLADSLGIPLTITAVGILTLVSGLVVAGVMEDTNRH
jgi:hypothetical protein